MQALVRLLGPGLRHLGGPVAGTIYSGSYLTGITLGVVNNESFSSGGGDPVGLIRAMTGAS